MPWHRSKASLPGKPLLHVFTVLSRERSAKFATRLTVNCRHAVSIRFALHEHLRLASASSFSFIEV